MRSSHTIPPATRQCAASFRIPLKACGAKISACLLLACACLLFGCTEHSDDSLRTNSVQTTEGYYLVSEGTLTVALTADDEPFQVKHTYEPTGFTVDLITLLAEELNLECAFTVTSDDEQVAAFLLGGEGEEDSVITVKEREEREAQAGPDADVGVMDVLASSPDALGSSLLATDPYLELGLALVVREEDEGATRDELADARIGMVDGSHAQAWVAENLANATAVVEEDSADLFPALRDGKVDALVCDQQIAEYNLRTFYQNMAIVERMATDRTACFAANTDNEALVTALNEALATLKADGRYDELYDTWFGEATANDTEPREVDPAYAEEHFNNASGW